MARMGSHKARLLAFAAILCLYSRQADCQSRLLLEDLHLKL